MPRLASLLDLFLDSGTRRFADCEDDRIPEYVAKLSAPVRLSRALPDPFFRLQAARTASIRLSNVSVVGDSEAPTVSEILAGEELLGKRALIRVCDVDSGTDLASLDGVVVSISGLTQSEAALEIEATDAAALQALLPRLTTLDLFGSAVVPSADHAPIVPFGQMRKAALAACHAHFLELVFGMVAAGGDNQRYEKLLAPANYQVASGDVLSYDLLWLDSGARIAIDLEATDGTRLRALGALDQNDHDPSPVTALPDPLVLGRWYRRRIELPAALDGKTISRFLFGCEADGDGTFHGYVANAAIHDSAGRLARLIFDETSPAPTWSTVYDGNVGANSFSATRHAVFDYGPIRKPTSGEMLVLNVYRAGRLVDPAEYEVVEPVPGFLLLRFALAQRDSGGSPLELRADLESTEFLANPARVVAFLLSDPELGLGQAVAAASVNEAAAEYAAAGYHLGGGLEARTPAIDLLVNLLLRGASLERDGSGAYTIAVDSPAAHPAASVSLGQGDEEGWQNCELASDAAARATERTTKLVLRGLLDPGFSGSGTFLLSTARERAGQGVTKEITLPFVSSIEVLDREADYLWKRLRALDRKLLAVGGSEVRELALGARVRIHSPNLFFSGLEAEVRGITLDGARAEVGLSPWDPALFSYEKGSSLKVDPRALVLTDYSRTYPPAPSSFEADAPVVIVNAANGLAEAKIRVRATAPPANVTHLVFQAVKEDLAAVRSRIDVSAQPGQEVEADLVLDPGLVYDLQVFARNTGNEAGFQDGFVSTLEDVAISSDIYAPSNTPAPTGISTSLGKDGSIDVALTWNPYVHGQIPADGILVLWRSGAAPLGAPDVTDKAMLLAPSATSFTFHGLDPDRNYRFGIAAVRSPFGSIGYVAGTVQVPTAAPDWADVSAIGDYTGNVGGTPAATVAANATAGKTAFDGTVNYRSGGAPTNAPAPSTIASALNADGSADYTIGWSYAQAAKPADGFLVFWKEGDGAPGFGDAHFDFGLGTSPFSFQLRGLPSDRAFSFGVAAYRRTDAGVELGAIISSTAAPDWQGISQGSPIYSGSFNQVAFADSFDADTSASYVQGGDQLAKWTWDLSDGLVYSSGGAYATLIRNGYLAKDCTVRLNSWEAAWLMLIARFLDNRNYYAVFLLDRTAMPTGNNLYLYKRVRGTFTLLGQVSVNFPRFTSLPVHLDLAGSSIKVRFNWTEVLSVVDSDLPGAGRVGLGGHIALSRVTYFEASGQPLSAADMLAAPPPPPVDVGGARSHQVRLGALLNHVLATLGSTVTIAGGGSWTPVMQATISIPEIAAGTVVTILANVAGSVTVISTGQVDTYWRLRRGASTILRTSGATTTLQGGSIDVPAFFVADTAPGVGSVTYYLEMWKNQVSGSHTVQAKTPGALQLQAWSN